MKPVPHDHDHLPAFDREVEIGDLLDIMDGERLLNTLKALLSTPVRLLAGDGTLVLGAPGDGTGRRAPLHHELDVVGFVESEGAHGETLSAAADLVVLLLDSVSRYRMVSDLHLEAVQEDYRVMKREHAALQASEARYRQLASHLEERVAEQVKTIDTAHRQLYQAEKMASVGQLAAGMAHEINNPIGFIRSNLGTARSYLGELREWCVRFTDGADMEALQSMWDERRLADVLPDFDELLGECVDGSDRIGKIVSDLRAFARIDDTGTEDVDVNGVIREVCNVAKTQFNGGTALLMELGEPLPRVHCDPALFGQVILNTLLNAAQAVAMVTDRDGEIGIVTGVVGDELCVTVRDTGCGIPPDVLPRIFDPFFTTKDVGDGTGLGLTVCADLVRNMGGRIEVDSLPGEGTTLQIYLPHT